MATVSAIAVALEGTQLNWMTRAPDEGLCDVHDVFSPFLNASRVLARAGT